jgi:hypothetical protein
MAYLRNNAGVSLPAKTTAIEYKVVVGANAVRNPVAILTANSAMLAQITKVINENSNAQVLSYRVKCDASDAVITVDIDGEIGDTAVSLLEAMERQAA